MQRADNRQTSPRFSRKFLNIGNIVLNLGILGVFKYYNFFVENFISAFASFGIHLQPHTLKIILPVGISFYTFQALSYSIDVYQRKIEPTKDIIAFFAYIGFFPLLVAGPIERATNLLPQFFQKRTFNYQKAVDGMRQILW
ncbi:MAG: MBOAT family protein, partial [Lachnoclostridium sp.]|nr:MBOAT family protein [Lachnoclostridium sp.]